MKCFMSSLLGLKLPAQEGNEVCEPLPPLVRSLIGGSIFLLMMLVFLCSTSGN